MSRVEKLLDAAESPSLNFLKYTRCRVRANKLPIFVFEGVDDPKYYTPRITYRFQQNWSALSVAGKRNVLALKDDISANPAYANDAVCFFVDKDFDETLQPKKICM